MVDCPTANFSGSDRALFSTAEIHRLMHAELEGAARYGHPMTLLMVGVDRLDHLTDLHGHESREDVLDAVIEVLLARLRVGDFLGSREADDAFLLALPFTPPEGARVLSQRLLEGARELLFEADGRSLRIALSIGAAYSSDEGRDTLDALIERARRGMDAAARAGGGRVVEQRPASAGEEEELARLRRELEARAELLRESRRVARPASAAVPAALERTLAAKLQALLEDASERDAREDDLERRIRDLMAQHDRQIDVLERRLGKLSCTLEATEGELQRMALLRDVDARLATGVMVTRGSDDPEARRGMMDAIFRANVALQAEIGELVV